MKWLYAVACSGAVGLWSFFEKEKKLAEASWTTNFTPSVKWDSNWDRRETMTPSVVKLGDHKMTNRGDEKEKRPTANRNLFFVRHGQYNMKGQDDSQLKLTALGQYQAECAGKRLKELNFEYSAIIQSTMTRAQETAALIRKNFPNTPLITTELLCEGAPIPPEPPIGRFKPEMKFFQQGATIEAAFRKFFHRADIDQKSDSYEIFVCHANVIRYFTCRALQFPPEAWLRFTLHHGSITWFKIYPDGHVIAYAIGDFGHIPADKLTTY